MIPIFPKLRPSVYAFRPTATNTLSNSKFSSFDSFILVQFIKTLELLFLTEFTLNPILNFSPCLVKIFLNSLEISLSMPGVI